MDIRSLEIIDPAIIGNKKIHIIGCGATGSHLAIQLLKLGFKKFILWDFDTVEFHNLTNQIWLYGEIKQPKVDALVNHMIALDPYLDLTKITKKGKWQGELLEDYVFVCVDSIELRKEIYEQNRFNTNIELIFDPRLGSTTGSVFTYPWLDKNIEQLINLTNYKDDEMDVERSLCGTPININTTLNQIVEYLLINFINYLNKQLYYKQVYFEPLKYRTTFLLPENE